MTKRDPSTRIIKSKGCWLWDGAHNPEGYGILKVNGKWTSAHRWCWAQQNGEIPINMMACHKCDNPSCVRPSHIFIGTRADNVNDSIRKGRWHWNMKKGEERPESKLTDEIVIFIRQQRNQKTFDANILSKKFGVCMQTIRKVARGASWKHIQGEHNGNNNKYKTTKSNNGKPHIKAARDFSLGV